MAIVELTANDVLQRCAHCESTNRVELSPLELGLTQDDIVDRGAVALPPCVTCRSVEFVFGEQGGAPPHPAPGSFGHLHGLLVQELQARLFAQGRISAGMRCKREAKDETHVQPLAPAVVREWFAQGMKLETSEPRGKAASARTGVETA